MDNLTHTLCGLTLARIGLDRYGPRATVALAVGANLPDVDVVTLLFGLDVYLVHHRGITHSLAGVAVQSLALAFLIQRWPAATVRPRMPPLLLCAFLGVASHLALDALNSYGVRPFLPFDASWSYGDALFIADPWLWLMLGAGAALGAARSRRIDGLWVLLLAGGAWLMVQSGRVPALAVATWTLGMAAILAARFGWLPQPRRRLAAAAGIGLAVLYIGAAFAGAAAARTRALAAIQTLLPAGARIDAASLTPLPAMPWRHECLVAHAGHVHRVRVDLLAGEVDLGAPIAQRLDDPILERVRMTQRLRAWRVFARVPYVARSGLDEVVLGDLRYGHEPAVHDWSSQTIPADR